MTEQKYQETSEEDDGYDYSDPEESTIRSGKGSGLISSIFF